MPKDVDLLIWTAVFDSKYAIKVTRTGPRLGELTVSESEQVLYRKPVDLSVDAPSGPDIDDVVAWHEMAIRFVQSLERP
jgi:hypothetical protein